MKSREGNKGLRGCDSGSARSSAAGVAGRRPGPGTLLPRHPWSWGLIDSSVGNRDGTPFRTACAALLRPDPRAGAPDPVLTNAAYLQRPGDRELRGNKMTEEKRDHQSDSKV